MPNCSIFLENKGSGLSCRKSVLILCTRNSCRSQMAEALLRSLAGNRLEIFSAGLDPAPIPEEVFNVMGELGLSLEGQHSKNVREFLGRRSFSHLITVCERAEKNCPTVFPCVGMHLKWSFDDPAAFEGTPEARLAMFRKVRDQIRTALEQWLATEFSDFSDLEGGMADG